MNAEKLETLDDDALKALAAMIQELLASRERVRKERAMQEAAALLASVGLTLRTEAIRKRVRAKRKPPTSG